MTSEFQKVIELERSRKITIGINNTHANNFWYSRTAISKILNWITTILILLLVYVLLKIGILFGLMMFIGISIYVIGINKIATKYVRILLLKDENLFDVAYNARSITIRNNITREIFSYPTDWKIEIHSL